jgi:RNA-directed DNA polymerase
MALNCRGEVSKRHSRLGGPQPKARTKEDEGVLAKSGGSASANRYVPGVEASRDEPAAGERAAPESTSNATLMDRVLERSNLQRALKQVRSNRGAPGIDGMSVDALPSYLKEHWLKIRAQLVAGRYRPRPVRRVEIPKPDGRKRPLGIPTVLDRFIQQAIAQVVSAQWEAHFHPRSYGFRPQRSAHQAVRQLQADTSGQALGGGPRPGSVLRSGQSRPIDGQTQAACTRCSAAVAD